MTRTLFLILICLGSLSCASTEEAGDRTPRRVDELRQPRQGITIPLASVHEEVKTIQLFLGDDERLLPILDLRSNQYLTLEFDLVDRRGEPLSVYFYHADREWNRDLVPAEFLASFQSDNILDYATSLGTEVPYTHYRYQFPNRNIQFTASGNYIVRVTEPGQETNVLFERAFFVTEQLVELGLSLDRIIAPNGTSAIQPLVQFVPSATVEPNIFDITVCFSRNGIFGAAKCSDRPSLINPPAVQYFLEPSSAFQPTSANYFLDLTSIRGGPRIERTDVSTSPYVIELDPDYQQFAGSGIDPLLNGQSLVSSVVRDVAEPRTSAQYVEVYFSFVPLNEVRLPGSLFVTGSFNNWKASSESELSWIPERGRYEGSVLVKQGQYEYRYHSSDVRTQRSINKGIPRPDNLITAMVYIRDQQKFSDRLLAANGFYSR